MLREEPAALQELTPGWAQKLNWGKVRLCYAGEFISRTGIMWAFKSNDFSLEEICTLCLFQLLQWWLCMNFKFFYLFKIYLLNIVIFHKWRTNCSKKEYTRQYRVWLSNVKICTIDRDEKILQNTTRKTSSLKNYHTKYVQKMSKIVQN